MLEGQCCWSGLNSLACDEGSVPAPRLSLVGSMRSFLHSGAPATQAAPPPFAELLEEPWLSLPNWNKGEGAAGWYR